MHESAFHYNVSRPYPYRWFNWATIIGGIAFTILFSVINLAAVGYETNTKYVTDLNATEHPPSAWYMKAPWSWASKISSKCESSTVTLGSQIYSNTSFFQYAVTDLAYGTSNRSYVASSITYRNHNLPYCNVTSLNLQSLSPDTGSTSMSMTADVKCTMYTEDEESVTMGLSTTVHDIDAWMLSVNSHCQSQPNFKCWFDYLNSEICYSLRSQNITYNWVLEPCCTPGYELELKIGASIYVNSSAILSPSVTVDLNENMMKTAQNTAAYFLLVDNSAGTGTANWIQYSVDSSTDKFPADLAPNIRRFLVLNGYSWFMYSMVLSDLGQSSKSNIFASPNLVSSVYNTTSNLAKTSPGYLACSASNYSSYYIPPPQVLPSTISRQYLCQVPKLKSTGTLIVSIVVADFVFLQVLWKLFTFTTTYFMARRHPEAMACATCARKLVASTEDEDGAVMDKQVIVPKTGSDYNQVPTTDHFDKTH